MTPQEHTNPPDDTLIQGENQRILQAAKEQMQEQNRYTALLGSSLLEHVKIANARPSQKQTVKHISAPNDWLRLPTNKTTVESKMRLTPQKYRWRIGLHRLGDHQDVIGIEFESDIILGRYAGTGEAPDLDLSAYDGQAKGVSRLHALLRPSRNNVYLIDLDSRNGTQVNGSSISVSMTRALHDNDVVALGELTFVVRIYEGPDSSAGV